MEIPSHAFSSSPLLAYQSSSTIRFGIGISYKTQIGPGLYIGHQGGIVINEQVVIGKNCNLSQQVTIGVSRRGERAGVPTMGDNVYIGPGAKIFGKIQVGLMPP
jgi:serine O-acetyltransferase